jgi:hypothetical protein
MNNQDKTSNVTMRIRNRLILLLITGIIFINLLLASLRQKDFVIYYIADSIFYFIVSLVYININPKSKTVLRTIGTIIFIGFIVLIAIEIAEMAKYSAS